MRFDNFDFISDVRMQQSNLPMPVVAYEAYQQTNSPALRDTGKGTFSLKRANTDFGAVFKKKNKRVGQQGAAEDNPLDRPCGVTVHDYSPTKYASESRQNIKDVADLLRLLPTLKEEKPAWAHVR